MVNKTLTLCGILIKTESKICDETRVRLINFIVKQEKLS